MGLKSGRRKIIGDCRRDRISSLPDEILSHILSFLPIKYAVQSSILSKRWKYLWTGVTNLDFDPGFYSHCRSNASAIDRYLNFVDRVLCLRNSADLHKFCVRISYSCDGVIDCHRITTWFNEAITRNVRELDFHIYVENFELPQSFFTCRTLTVLKMNIDHSQVFDVPASISFPSVKILHVYVSCPPTDLMQKLFRSCPVLEDLSIDGELFHHFYDDQELIFDVSAPALKRLRVWLTYDDVREVQHKFVFNAPNLEYIDLYEQFLAKYIVENLSSLVEARISIGDSCQRRKSSQAYPKRAFELLEGISSVVRLFLCQHTMTALDFAYHNNLPTFHNLMHLEVIISHCSGWKLLPNLLESTPNLKDFDLLKEEGCGHDGDQVLEDYDWCEVQSVPTCLSLHLVAIKNTGFEEKRDELRVIEYLLRNAKVLEHLCIYSFGLALENEVKFCKNVLKFPRGSSSCQIQFNGDNFLKF